MKDDRTWPNGSVVVTIELPGADSLSCAALGMSEPLSKLAVLKTVLTEWHVYDEATGTAVTTLRPDSTENWNTPIGQFGGEAGSAVSVWPSGGERRAPLGPRRR
jgi:hypothetical protein